VERLRGHRGTVRTPAVSPDGAKVAFPVNAGPVAVFDVRAGSPSWWERHACLVAGRRLTRAERHDARPDRAYAPAC
jgi:hypothetical protein